jgi:hypothetical protein
MLRDFLVGGVLKDFKPAVFAILGVGGIPPCPVKGNGGFGKATVGGGVVTPPKESDYESPE